MSLALPSLQNPFFVGPTSFQIFTRPPTNPACFKVTRPKPTTCVPAAPNHHHPPQDDVGIPMDDVKVLAKFKSRFNYIRVMKVSWWADHPLAGFRARSTAQLLLELYPNMVVHGWELDPSIIAVEREFFGLADLEKKYKGRVFIYIGNALDADLEDGFSGIFVDLFSKGCVIPELQDPDTWLSLKRRKEEEDVVPTWSAT